MVGGVVWRRGRFGVVKLTGTVRGPRPSSGGGQRRRQRRRQPRGRAGYNPQTWSSHPWRKRTTRATRPPLQACARHHDGCRRRARHLALHRHGSHCCTRPSHSTLGLTAAPQRLRRHRAVGFCSRGRVRSSTCPALLAKQAQEGRGRRKEGHGTRSRRRSGACCPPPSTKAVMALGGPTPVRPRGPAARRCWPRAPCRGRRCSFPSST